MRSEYSIALVLVLLAIGGAIGAVAGVGARPRPTPVPTVALTPSPRPTPTPFDPAAAERAAFSQPLAAGCATDAAVWLFADGGTAIRYDGQLWTIPDPSLRSLEAAACRGSLALAVGAGGSILTADDARRTVHADRSGTEALHGIAILPDGALAVGDRGTVLRQSATDWTPIGAGIPQDLYGVAARQPEAWLVGAAGVAYRLTSAGWELVPTGADRALRAVEIAPDRTALAAGDDGVLLRWSGSAWARLASGTPSSLRAIATVADVVWVVGDAGTVLTVSGHEVRPMVLGTTCTLRAVFAQGAAVWIVGSDGLRGGAWRIEGDAIGRWGSC